MHYKATPVGFYNNIIPWLR